MKIGEALQFGIDELNSSLTPRLDAEVLLGFAMQKNRAWLFSHDDESLSLSEEEAYNNFVKRRKSSEPVAYITGQKEFYGRNFIVTPDVLIPRPDSELFISLLKEILDSQAEVSIADIGTGSGCLTITTSLEFPRSTVIGIDPSQKALDIAQQNANRFNARVRFQQSSLLESVDDKSLDIILSNLPYLTEVDLRDSETASDLAFEPRSALLASDDGLELIKLCAKQSKNKLKKDGRLFLEMMPYQVPNFIKWLEQIKTGFSHTVHKDLSNYDRIVELRLDRKG